MSVNPYVEKVECHECGRTVRANTRTGLLYSHNRPDSTETCPASGKFVAPMPHADKPTPAPPDKPPAQRPTAPDRPVDERTGSKSVRTWRGGLPGLGRKR